MSATTKPFRKKRKSIKVNVNDVILLTHARVGVVRYIGYVDGKSQSHDDKYIGVEIRITDGYLGETHNGVYNQKQYFQCAGKTGLFVEPHQIVQIYAPEDLLEMIIGLKDKLLPLLHNNESASKQSPSQSKSRSQTKSPSNTSQGSYGDTWSARPMMQYIREEEHVQENHPKPKSKPKARTKSKAKSKSKSRAKAHGKGKQSSSGNSVHFNLKIDAAVQSAPPPRSNTHSSSLSKEEQQLQHRHKVRRTQSTTSTFDSVDMHITAPMGLLSYFGDMDEEPQNSGKLLQQQQQQQQRLSTLSPTIPSPTTNKHGHSHFHGHTRLSLLRAHSQENSGMLASYSKLKLLHRCVTLRRKIGNHAHASTKKSIVLDLAHFGRFLKEENISQQHAWFDAIWNKYDKLFRLKIDFYFVSELLSDLLNEYLMHEHDTNVEQIMSVDIKRTIQQIIVHIRPYHLEKHNAVLSPIPSYDMIDEEVDNDDEQPFMFADFQSLGDWLCEIEEMEEEEEDEDYFMMDIHYWDMVQYVLSHKHHVWKKVVMPFVTQQQHKGNGVDVKRMEQVMQKVIIDYGRNGLGNVNMQIYSSQIKEYASHLTKLFSEHRQSQTQSLSFAQTVTVTQQQFFEFIQCVPQL